MKKSYVIQMVIDVILAIFGVILFMYPKIFLYNVNMIFFISISIYAGLELSEFILDRTRKEPLYLFFTSAAAAFSSVFLRQFPANYVLAAIICFWTITNTIIKLNSLTEIDKNKKNLFLIRVLAMSIFTMLGLLVSINMYYRISSIGYMLALLFMCYGTFEFACDISYYLSIDKK